MLPDHPTVLGDLRLWAEHKGFEVVHSSGTQQEPTHVVALRAPGHGRLLAASSLDDGDVAAMRVVEQLKLLGAWYGEDLTAPQCMFRAYDGLVGAVERYRKAGDTDMAAKVAALAEQVADLDPRRGGDAR